MPPRSRATRWSTGLLAALVVCLVLPTAASAVNFRTVWVSNGQFAGSNNLSALRINANGTLSALPGSPFSSSGTIHEGIAVTPDARRLYLAAFSGTVNGFNLSTLGVPNVAPGSPFATGSTPLGVTPAPVAKRVYVWNHGNNVGAWNINNNGSLSQIAGSPFAVTAGHTNPFAGSASPDGKNLYVPLENTVPFNQNPDRLTVYRINANGSLSIIQSVATGDNPFGSAITPNGKFVYVSNNQEPPAFPNGSISGFARNANTGTLTPLPGSKFSTGAGNHPLAMAVSPDSKTLFVATPNNGTVTVFRINANGSLSQIAGSPFGTGGTFSKALALTPDAKRLYVSNFGTNNISAFNVAANGALTPIPGFPVPTGGVGPDLESIAITPNQPPTAKFKADVKEAKQATEFDAGESQDTDGGTVTKYVWDFGDGSPAKTTTTAKTTHTYDKAGTYAVTVTITDNENCSIELIFSGKATLCNGSLQAKAAGTAIVPAPKPGPGQNEGRFRGGGPLAGPGVIPGAPRCRGRRATIVGTRGRNRLRGTRRADVIVGLGGGDRISARGGNDLVCGNSGNDRISGGSGADRLFGNSGRDRISGGRGRDRIFGGSGRDRVKQ